MATPTEVIYTAEPDLRHPMRLIRSMGRDLLLSRQLVWRLIRRDISAQYRQTALGYVWAVLPVLVTTSIFVAMNAADVLRIGETGVPYAVYAVTGMTLFALLTESMNAPLRMVTASRAMLVRANFPREALLIASLGQVVFSFVVKVCLLIVVVLAYGVPVRATAPLALASAFGVMLIGLMVGVVLAPLGALFQDVSYWLAALTAMLVFLTPAVYAVPRSGTLARIIAANPATPLIMSARHFMFGGSPGYGWSALVVIAITLTLLFLGWVLFRLALPVVVERLGG